MPLISFAPAQVISSSAVNANYGLCMLTDTSRTVSVTHTYTASQTFTGGWIAGAGCTVSTGGFTVTAGGLTVTAGGLTVTAGGLTVSAGTTAVQALTATTGTLSGLGISDSWQMKSGSSTFLGSTERCITGDNSSALNLAYSVPTGGSHKMGVAGSFQLTLSATALTLSSIGITGATSISTSGNLTFTAASTKIIPGATALAFRNNADSADNLSIADSGAAIFRGTVLASSFGVNTSTAIGFYGSAGSTQIQVSGSKAANAALGSLLTALNTLGLISDLTT